jgi:hypothetical protein
MAGRGARRNAMVHLFLNPSPLLVAGELVLALSVPMFVGALIAAFGDRMRLSGRRELENRQTTLDARADNVAVGHEMHHFLFGPRDETLADEVEDWALGDDGTAEIGVRPLASLEHGGKKAA